MSESDFSFHVCHQPGLTMDGGIIEQLADGSYKARAKIGTIFGAEVEGEVTGQGATKEEALAQLKKNQDDLYESLWL